jgi:8-oxo-dGTP pyrophosphatase MutT (NUDIX family)
MKIRDQFGVVPVSQEQGWGLQVLLVTSRETRRWVIPKGWPMHHLSPAQAGAREALEEAGVAGKTSEEAIGSYVYQKRLEMGGFITCRVTVFLLHVNKEYRHWPEKAQRRRQWFAPEVAASLVQEPELAKLLREIEKLPAGLARPPHGGTAWYGG